MSGDDDGCFISVICPVYNDPEGIRETLTSVVDVDYPQDRFEVLVVDNGSTDQTPIVIQSFADSYPEIVSHIIEDEIQSSYAARNKGIKHATGEVIAFIDADMTVKQSWLKSIEDVLDSTTADYIGCKTRIYTPESGPTIWSKYDLALGLPVEKYIEKDGFAPTCSLIVRQQVFDEVGNFDHRLVSGGDKEFGHRVRDAGFQMAYTDEIVLEHPARVSSTSWLKKAQRIGKGSMQLRRYHSDRYETPHPLHPIHYLPPSPFRLRDRFTNRVEVTIPEIILLFCIEYLLKLVQSYSRLDEMVCDE
ncbi:glycosyltransferase [Natronorubrum aibiense]|uniref:Glycosyltransferase n=1 Tax=Natronorubrum aibiense TaxID=348826 RepID=A0A5P9P2H7_9EURY|nr:glycosyltransferase [Natronorubrum aibiense]QFU82333.1 glycosyltransferase [Natronorubrum aibiense]